MEPTSTIHNQRLKDVSFIVKDLLKVIKVVSTYPLDNPLPQSMKRSFAEKLVDIVEIYGEIPLHVEKDRLIFGDDTVFQDRSKEERLAGVFFETGITDFTFREGLEVDEVYKLLDVIKDYVNSPDKTQDLAALIWESGIDRFAFRTVEDVALSEYDSSFNVQEFLQSEAGGRHHHSQFGTDEVEQYSSIFEFHSEGDIPAEEASLDDSSGTGLVTDGAAPVMVATDVPFHATGLDKTSGDVTDEDSLGDISARSVEAAEALGFGVGSGDAPPVRSEVPDTTLILNDEFALSEEEEEVVRRLLAEDAEFDANESSLEIIREMLLQETEMNAFYETVTIGEKVLNEFVQVGRLLEAGQLLQHLKELDMKIRDKKPLWAERLRDAYITAGSRDRLATLAESLNSHPDIGVAELKRYLDNFGWEALSGITDLLGEFEHRLHREALRDYLTARGETNIDVVSRGIFDKRWYVVHNSIIILAGIGSSRALSYLKRVLQNDERRVRLELVNSLKDCPSDEALDLLRACAADRDPEIRKEAVNSIVARRGRAAFDTITEIINDDGFPELEREDQQSLLNAFSILGGEQAVNYLSQLILKYNLFRDPILSFYRVAAFEALSLNRSEKSERLLVRLSGSWRPDVKQQAVSALQRRREIMFGGE